MTVQADPYRGADYDDTSINGLNIMCSDKKGNSQHENWYSGWWGRWQYIYDFDPLLKVVGAGVEIDYYFHHDNEGLTGLKLARARF